MEWMGRRVMALGGAAGDRCVGARREVQEREMEMRRTIGTAEQPMERN